MDSERNYLPQADHFKLQSAIDMHINIFLNLEFIAVLKRLIGQINLKSQIVTIRTEKSPTIYYKYFNNLSTRFFKQTNWNMYAKFPPADERKVPMAMAEKYFSEGLVTFFKNYS